ncbi:LSU ribosomal protein L10P [Thalassoporum mexicanum PCC 7367]|uniref:50S ribosomal protein L10 n=1 Tax=Thalassoporum mexicanum TaxID=3457544 RepID=UPI00029F8F0A|nr:50S ribosomal protein L10 [Pseudanabaena sp. PCC 7367]AFY68656.1 LSU ribosomal protein L10P [Pseudanabaena sp. PCC 7367]
MGRSPEDKQQLVSQLESQLTETQMVMVIDYGGLSVAEITDLRRRLRDSETTCMVVKNTLMRIAIARHEHWQPMGEYLKGATACLFVKGDMASAVKAYQAFKKDTKKTELRGGVFDGRALDADALEAVSKLPSREELLAQIAGVLNSATSRVAIGLNQVPTSLARALNDVPSSLGRAIKAAADQKEAA